MDNDAKMDDVYKIKVMRKTETEKKNRDKTTINGNEKILKKMAINEKFRCLTQ